MLKRGHPPKTSSSRVSDSPAPISLTAEHEKFSCDANPISIKVRFSDLSSRILFPLKSSFIICKQIIYIYLFHKNSDASGSPISSTKQVITIEPPLIGNSSFCISVASPGRSETTYSISFKDFH